MPTQNHSFLFGQQSSVRRKTLASSPPKAEAQSAFWELPAHPLCSTETWPSSPFWVPGSNRPLSSAKGSPSGGHCGPQPMLAPSCPCPAGTTAVGPSSPSPRASPHRQGLQTNPTKRRVQTHSVSSLSGSREPPLLDIPKKATLALQA